MPNPAASPANRVKPMRVKAMTKTYGSGDTAVEVLAGLDLSVGPGEVVCIVGPSGVGKTTLLRCLSGLAPVTSGEVRVGDELVTAPLAEIGLVFQDYRGSLLPWMRAIHNVAFPLEGRGVGKKERLARAQACLEDVGLGEAAYRYPWELSGGMQQRVAIARALAYDAHILLMDEPFGSLDAQTRFELEDLLRTLQKRLGISIVVVTHDIDEAVYLADRVVVLSGKPARVIDTVDIGLGPDRDQIKTKSDPHFADYRSRILGEIMSQAGPTALSGFSGRKPK